MEEHTCDDKLCKFRWGENFGKLPRPKQQREGRQCPRCGKLQDKFKPIENDEDPNASQAAIAASKDIARDSKRRERDE